MRHSGSPSSFLAPGGRGLSARASILAATRLKSAAGRCPISFDAEGANVIRYGSGTQFSGPYEAFLHRLPRFSFLVGALSDHESIVEVLPLLAIAFEVELDEAVSLVISQEANAFHRFYSTSCGYARSNSSTSAPLPLIISEDSPSIAAPSPAASSIPLTVTLPRATCSQP